MSKGASVAKATKAVAAVKGTVKTITRKVRTSPHFYRPKTAVYSRSPKAPAHLLTNKDTKMDIYRIVKVPLYTEAAFRKIDKNCLVFLCDIAATKAQIARAIEVRFDVKVAKVNTLIRPDAQKKAYVTLDKSYDASELATKLKLFQ